MKISAINDFIYNNTRKSAGDWDDIANIPDIADTLTDDNKESENPLCYDFWLDKINSTNYYIDKNYHEIADNYKKMADFLNN